MSDFFCTFATYLINNPKRKENNMAQNISTTQYEHVITYADGHKRVARLFFSREGNLCEFNKRSRKYGHYFDSTGVVNIEPLNKEQDLLKKTRSFIKKVIATLEKSGLWSNFLHDFKIVAQLDDERLGKFLHADWDESQKIMLELGLNHRQCGVDCLKWTVEKGIKSINYGSWDKQQFMPMFAKAIEEKKSFGHDWRKGYDNSVECRFDEKDNVMRAWYSEEYKGCGNGHYYYAIDATHAIFGEDD